MNKFDAGVFAAGETFQVIVNDAGAVEFYVDGDLKYTSSTAPSFPLYADTSFHNHLADARQRALGSQGCQGRERLGGHGV